MTSVKRLQNKALIHTLRASIDTMDQTQSEQPESEEEEMSFVVTVSPPNRVGSGPMVSESPVSVGVHKDESVHDSAEQADQDEDPMKGAHVRSTWARGVLDRIDGARRILSAGGGHPDASLLRDTTSPAAAAAKLAPPYISAAGTPGSHPSFPTPATPLAAGGGRSSTPRLASGRPRTPASAGSQDGERAGRGWRTPASASALSVRSILESEAYHQVRPGTVQKWPHSGVSGCAMLAYAWSWRSGVNAWDPTRFLACPLCPAAPNKPSPLLCWPVLKARRG